MADDVPRAWVDAAREAYYEKGPMDFSLEKLLRAALIAVAPMIANAERKRILEGVRYEASMRACAEDTVVIRYIATLIEADFSYDKSDELAAPGAET